METSQGELLEGQRNHSTGSSDGPVAHSLLRGLETVVQSGGEGKTLSVVSVWDDEKVLEIDGGHNCPTM